LGQRPRKAVVFGPCTEHHGGRDLRIRDR